MRPVMTSDVGSKDGVRTPKVFFVSPKVFFVSPKVFFVSPKVILNIPRVMQKVFLLFCVIPFNSYLCAQI
jgi:hypothetical protein